MHHLTRSIFLFLLSFSAYSSGFSQPVNDECSGAVILAIQPFTATGCTNGTAGTTVGATKSTVPASSSFGSSSDDDVWYQFTATATTHAVRFCNVTFPIGGIVPMNTSLHPGCTTTDVQITGSNQAIIITSGEGTGTLSNLIIGNSYKLRVLTNSTTSRADFTISILIAPPVPDCVTLVSPANGATNVSIISDPLTWINPSTGGTATSYKIYFGTAASPPFFNTLNGAGRTRVYINNQLYNTKYYWYIVPTNAGGDAIGCNSPIFSYTTASQPPPPANDICSGATNLTPTPGVFVDPGLQSTESVTATGAPGACTGASTSDLDLWYKFTTGSVGGTQTFNVSPTLATDIVVVGYTNAGACSGTSICADNLGQTSQPEVLVFTGLAANSTYNFRVYGYSGGAIAPKPFNFSISAVPGGVLPVVLKSFTGAALNTGNQLVWETLSEQNIDYYTVERSLDATNWSEIGRINVAGNSQLSRKYSITDATPAAKSLYRLRTVDRDGKTQFSGTVILTRNISALAITSLYPSPARDNITLQFNSVTSEKVTIRIMDVFGRIVKEIKVASNGNSASVPIPLQGMQPGTYSVTVSDSIGKSASGRFVKY